MDTAFRQVFSCPEVIRPFLMKFLPACRNYKSALKNMQKMMTPTLENQINIMKRGKKFPEPDGSMPFIKLLIEQELRKDPNREVNMELLANRLILMWGETSGPVIGMMASMVFEVMRNQECIEPLRKELEAALQLSGDEWNFDMFKHTPKLESYTLEIFRLYPFSSGKYIFRLPI